MTASFSPALMSRSEGCHVFIIQSTNPPAENLMELLLMIDAAKRASAYKVNAVIPYYGYAQAGPQGQAAGLSRCQAHRRPAYQGRC
ncbi:MAG: ribose-phosphate pyrophosphokinase-like domain-containing protein [Marinilabiliales bacterium]|nr:ribose-phosphate pyrophosphokinase-like domain-containing protein [Marinilabiliales bacterium]